MGGVAPPKYFQICNEVGQKLARQAARGLATVFSVTFILFSNNLGTIVGQLVRTSPPPQQKVSRHITALEAYLFSGFYHEDLFKGGGLKHSSGSWSYYI